LQVIIKSRNNCIRREIYASPNTRKDPFRSVGDPAEIASHKHTHTGPERRKTGTGRSGPLRCTKQASVMLLNARLSTFRFLSPVRM